MIVRERTELRRKNNLQVEARHCLVYIIQWQQISSSPCPPPPAANSKEKAIVLCFLIYKQEAINY